MLLYSMCVATYEPKNRFQFSFMRYRSYGFGFIGIFSWFDLGTTKFKVMVFGFQLSTQKI